MEWLNALVQGTLLGGLYALFAAGLSLIFGVMRLVNIAHGDLIVLAAYLGLTTSIVLGLHPVLALIIVVPLPCSMAGHRSGPGPLSGGSVRKRHSAEKP